MHAFTPRCTGLRSTNRQFLRQPRSYNSLGDRSFTIRPCQVPDRYHTVSLQQLAAGTMIFPFLQPHRGSIQFGIIHGIQAHHIKRTFDISNENEANCPDIICSCCMMTSKPAGVSAVIAVERGEHLGNSTLILRLI